MFVYGFAPDIHVGSKPMGIKKAQIRIWTIHTAMSERG
jgi:hypothetical protein